MEVFKSYKIFTLNRSLTLLLECILQSLFVELEIYRNTPKLLFVCSSFLSLILSTTFCIAVRQSLNFPVS